MTGRPRSRGSSRCSTEAKNASRSAWRIVAVPDTNICSHRVRLAAIRESLYSRASVTADGRRAGRTRSVVLIALVGLLVVAGSGYLASGSSATPTTALQFITPSFPGGPYFNVACGFSHRNNDDPIVFPGDPGRSHNHTFIGNRNVDAATTPESLKDGESSCGELDSSTYWVPTLFEGVDAVPPLAAVVYYTRHTNGSVATIPPGLKMVAGNQNAKRPQPKGIVSWSCGGGASKKFAVVIACPRGQRARVQSPLPELLEREDDRQPRPQASHGVLDARRVPGVAPRADPDHHRPLHLFTDVEVRSAGIGEVRFPRRLHERLGSDAPRSARVGSELLSELEPALDELAASESFSGVVRVDRGD